MESDADRIRLPLDSVIGLGANVGAPRVALARAVLALGRLGDIRGVSALYETSPVGGPPQPNFLNAAVRLSYRGSPSMLLSDLRAIEQGAGRLRRERWGPRCLDLDILWVAGLHLSQPDLDIPHPRLRERAFALRPLIDVAPEARDPQDEADYAGVLQRLGCAGVAELEGDWVGQAQLGAAAGMDRACP